MSRGTSLPVRSVAEKLSKTTSKQDGLTRGEVELEYNLTSQNAYWALRYARNLLRNPNQQENPYGEMVVAIAGRKSSDVNKRFEFAWYRDGYKNAQKELGFVDRHSKAYRVDISISLRQNSLTLPQIIKLQQRAIGAIQQLMLPFPTENREEESQSA